MTNINYELLLSNQFFILNELNNAQETSFSNEYPYKDRIRNILIEILMLRPSFVHFYKLKEYSSDKNDGFSYFGSIQISSQKDYENLKDFCEEYKFSGNIFIKSIGFEFWYNINNDYIDWYETKIPENTKNLKIRSVTNTCMTVLKYSDKK